MAQKPNPAHSRSLPAHANLEHLKNEAKQRLRELRANAPETKLADVQLEIARNYGFPSWRALKAHVDPMPIDILGMAALIQVFDMPASLAFYRDLLGFKVVQASRAVQSQWVRAETRVTDDRYDWVLLRLKDIQLMLNTAHEAHERPDSPDPARVAAHRDMTIFFGCRSVDEAYEYLHSKGIAAKPPITQSYGMRQLTVRDPDGYLICFQHPADR
ncbi:MAG: VOC family protein [Alphaproteobacteria bacterium]